MKEHWREEREGQRDTEIYLENTLPYVISKQALSILQQSHPSQTDCFSISLSLGPQEGLKTENKPCKNKIKRNKTRKASATTKAKKKGKEEGGRVYAALTADIQWRLNFIGGTVSHF